MKAKYVEYDLYFDESGDFTENSTNRDERNASLTRLRRAASQYVGLLAPRGSLNERAAADVLRGLEPVAGGPVTHTTEIRDSTTVRRLIEAVVPKIQKRGWQPVRLVNDERVQFGDRANTMITMAAELVVRVLRQKQVEGDARIALRIFPAGVKLGEDEQGRLIQIEDEDYETRLRDAIGYINVRRGHPFGAKTWKIDHIQLGSGRRWSALILCDLLSNASYDNFGRLDEAAQETLEEAFGAYSFTLAARELLERADARLRAEAYGGAIRLLLEHLVQEGDESAIMQAAIDRIQQAIDALARTPARTRDPQLREILAALEQVVEGDRTQTAALRWVRLLKELVVQPLQSALGDDVHLAEWFEYSLACSALTACNHAGRLLDGETFVQTIDRLAPRLARQWEHARLMTQGLIARAVHKTDCFQFDEAARSMEKLIRCDEAVAELFADAMFGGDERVHSDLRAQALGTWLQAEILAGRSDASRISKARELSDLALQEFRDAADIRRQCQYRCQLEVAAGDFPAATEYLGRSLQLPGAGHREIGHAIERLAADAPGKEGFAWLHWLRLGTAMVHENPHSSASEEFLQAADASGVFQSPWARGVRTDYPAHGILRRVAILQAALNRPQRALETLTILRKELPSIPQRQVVLRCLQIAAVIEVASVLWSQQPVHGRRVLNPTKSEGVAVSRMIAHLREQTGDRLPHLTRLLEDWSATIDFALKEGRSSKDAARRLRVATRAIDY